MDHRSDAYGSWTVSSINNFMHPFHLHSLGRLCLDIYIYIHIYLYVCVCVLNFPSCATVYTVERLRIDSRLWKWKSDGGTIGEIYDWR